MSVCYVLYAPSVFLHRAEQPNSYPEDYHSLLEIKRTLYDLVEGEVEYLILPSDKDEYGSNQWELKVVNSDKPEDSYVIRSNEESVDE